MEIFFSKKFRGFFVRYHNAFSDMHKYPENICR